jgi:hypothetical protein
MTQPTSMTRFLATPRVATALYVGCSVAVLGGLSGAVPWWLAFVALCFIGTVRKAVQDVRRYKQWRAAWDGMGQKRLCGCGHPECTDGTAAMRATATPKASPRGRKASSRWTGVIVAALLLFPIIPVVIATPGASEGLKNGLTLLWLATAVYLVCKLAVSVRRAPIRKGAGAIKPSAAADVVEWVLPPASSYPSRADAIRQLPDYCTRLITAAGSRMEVGQ